MPPTIKHVGYVGLGIMGSAMAGNLLKAGFQVTVWNRTPAKTLPLARLGAKVADCPCELARQGAQVVCINVTDTPDVEHVIFSDDGVTEHATPGLIIVDHSTISPVATRQFAQRLAEKGITFLDAPVTGGDVGAKNATLSIMVGGPAEAFERCLPVFQAMGKTVTHVGESGMGQVCKACNQIAGAVSLMGVCEALALAKKSGLDPRKMIQVISAGASNSWAMTNLAPKIVDGDYAPGFMIDLVLKDLGIVQDASRKLRLPLPGAAIAEAYFRAAAAGAPAGGKDGIQAMAKAIEQAGNVKLAE